MDNFAIDKNFVVIGCGGLGCYIIENLLRLQVKGITVCDGDCFAESNLNRQLYATPATLGKSKVECAKNRASELAYAGVFTAIPEFFTQENADRILQGADIVIDALDNVESRLLLEDACSKNNLPLVHGAVGGWIYQVTVCMPGSNKLHKIYGSTSGKNINENICFIVQTCAARQVAEAVKLALNIETDLKKKIYLCDLEENYERQF